MSRPIVAIVGSFDTKGAELDAKSIDTIMSVFESTGDKLAPLDKTLQGSAAGEAGRAELQQIVGTVSIGWALADRAAETNVSPRSPAVALLSPML